MKFFGRAASFWQHFKEAQSGATAIIFAIMVIPLLVVSGGAVDYGRALKTKAQLAMALDAAILAAMKEYSLDKTTDYEKVIKDFINKNLSEEDKAYLGQTPIVTVSDIDDNGELQASVAAKVSTSFLKVVGFNEFSIRVDASAVAGGKDLEVVLILDNTGSMGNPASGGGTKIVALRKSAADLVDILMADSGEDRVKIALVPFAEYVNIGMDMRSEEGLDIPDDYEAMLKMSEEIWDGRRKRKRTWTEKKEFKWYGCMGSRKHDLNVKDEGYGTAVPGVMMFWDPVVDMKKTTTPYQSWRCPAASIIDLTDEKATITAGIADMTAVGWTYIPTGLSWGWRVLSDEAPFTSGAPDSDDDVTKVIVLMTDGENTRAPKKWKGVAAKKHSGEIWGHSVFSTQGAAAKADPLTAELCENIKEKDIVIFTIAFAVPDGSKVEKLMKACAGNGGQFFDADNAEELDDAFHQIGLSLLNLRLSQ